MPELVRNVRCTITFGSQYTFISKDGEVSHKEMCLKHYENTPIQIYRKFYLQKPKIFK